MWNGVPLFDRDIESWHLVRFFYKDKPETDYVDIALHWTPNTDWNNNSLGIWTQYTLGAGIITIYAENMHVKEENTKQPEYRGVLTLITAH